MNYIRHLNKFFTLIKNDEKLSATHVSLYMALFQYWNFNRFHNPFAIYRENIMQLSRIGSKNTYHKCIKELHEAKYIIYHPAPAKFQVVRISIIKLDTGQPPASKYRQLDLFTPLESLSRPGGSAARSAGGCIEEACPISDTPSGPISDTEAVPKSIHTSVPHPVHPIKHTKPKQRETLPQNFNEMKNNAKKNDRSVPKSVPNHIEWIHVEAYFHQQNHPLTEARKFFNHYKALGWKIQGTTPIADWKALAEKWMQNAAKWKKQQHPAQEQQSNITDDITTTLQYLYERYLEGTRITKFLDPVFFDHLRLKVTDATLQQSWQRRINQLSGSNEYSEQRLWQAYMTYDPQHELVKKDWPNFIALAKKLSILKHFEKLKSKGIKTLPP